jgi:site-specific DNA recombinase
MRAVIYNRVSQDRNGESRSVAEQDHDNRAVCERQGWPIVGAYEDNDRSASRYAKKDRPDWERLCGDLAAGVADVLVVWEISRAHRDRTVWAALAETCLEHSVRLCVGGRIHDLDDPDDGFVLDLGSALAVRESAQTRKRVQRAVAANAMAGRPHGKLLYGYRREYAATSRGARLLRQVIADDQAAVIRELAERVCAGESCRAIASDLNRRGIAAPRSGSWDLSKVKATVTNPGYIAKRVHRGQIVGDADWPAILEEATYWSAVARLTDPTRKTMRDAAVVHLLSGIVVCGAEGCGTPLRVGKNRTVPAYLCRSGFHTACKAETLENYVTAVVVGRLSQPDMLAELERQRGGGRDVRAEATAVAELRGRLDLAADQYADGSIDAEQLRRITARLRPRLEAAERQARERHVSTVLATVAAEATSAGPAALWRRLPLETKRAVIRDLATIRLLPIGSGHRTFRTWRVVFADPITGEIWQDPEALAEVGLRLLSPI